MHAGKRKTKGRGAVGKAIVLGLLERHGEVRAMVVGRYVHNVMDHAECYAKDKVHTNTMENFWALLKRSIKGTYVAVEPFHLFRYLDKESFRYNHRRTTDAQRFLRVVAGAPGKRLTYNGLIGEKCPNRTDTEGCSA